MTTFVEKIIAVHDALDAARMPHGLGGALALGFHVAAPRATLDIDLNVTADPARAREVLDALPPGVSHDERDSAQLERDGQVRVFWDRTPIDLFLPQHALHAVVARRTGAVTLAGREIPVISATDLAIFKALYDRPKDWVDIADLLEYGEVDAPEVARWLAELVGRDDARTRRFAALA